MSKADQAQLLVGLNTPAPRTRNRPQRKPDSSKVLGQLDDGAEKVSGSYKSTASAEIKLNPKNQRTRFLTELRKGKKSETVENLFLESLHWIFKAEQASEIKNSDVKGKVIDLINQQLKICPAWEGYDLDEIAADSMKLYLFAHNVFINGVQTPPGVMQVGNDTNNIYTVSWGNRRVCAHKIAFGTESAIVVGLANRKKDADEALDLQEKMIIENSAREDKSTLEGFIDYHTYISALPDTANKDASHVSKVLGKSIKTVYLYNRLIKSGYIDMLAKGGFGKTGALIMSYDSLIKESPGLIDDLVKSAAGDPVKLLELFKEVISTDKKKELAESEKPKTKAKKKSRGRQTQYITFPKVKSPTAIKSLITGGMKDNEFFKNIDWDDNSPENLTVISNAIKLALTS